MSDLERRICQVIADLMNGVEPDWFRAQLPKEMREEIRSLAESQRSDGALK